VVTLVTSPPDDPRLFAVELNGWIQIIEHDKLRPEPFIDLSLDAGGPVVNPGPVSEMGLLGLAFDPHYAENHYFYVFYTAHNLDPTDMSQYVLLDVLERYTASATDPYKAEPGSGVRLLEIKDRFGNHNGGMLEFGPDGYLYIGTGDGGGATESDNGRLNSQDHDSLLGKILRIDVARQDPGLPYAIPADNPFSTGRREVYMLGLRNPWRWSFDHETGDLWIGDVGEWDIEELDFVARGEQAGKNFGWPRFEGKTCFRGTCDETGLTFPDAEHRHADGWGSIIGGQVYRGSCFPDLVGTYVYSDLVVGTAQTLRRRPDGKLEDGPEILDSKREGPASLHADSRGELYMTTIKGEILQIVMSPPDP
jgi:glucose/arabinose dehydrogenase